ncbi:MAG: HepT-like ribonuclease domain-containing protein [Bacteroidota bacterium]
MQRYHGQTIIGIRNRLIHGYDDINHEILWQTVTEDLPKLLIALKKILTK